MRFWKPTISDSALFDEARAIGERVGLGPRIDVIAGNPAHGEQQMLAIGRALMTNPNLLILDESTEGLSPLIREEIWNCLGARASTARRFW